MVFTRLPEETWHFLETLMLASMCSAPQQRIHTSLFRCSVEHLFRFDSGDGSSSIRRRCKWATSAAAHQSLTKTAFNFYLLLKVQGAVDRDLHIHVPEIITQLLQSHLEERSLTPTQDVWPRQNDKGPEETLLPYHTSWDICGALFKQQASPMGIMLLLPWDITNLAWQHLSRFILSSAMAGQRLSHSEQVPVPGSPGHLLWAPCTCRYSFPALARHLPMVPATWNPGWLLPCVLFLLGNVATRSMAGATPLPNRSTAFSAHSSCCGCPTEAATKP